ncbi:MAG: CHAD domain-containing protein [Candidatus Electrothrix sp. YB6]
MKLPAQLARKLADASALREIADKLGKKYSLKEQLSKTEAVSFFDSFDWRLYAGGLLCFLRNDMLHLTDYADREVTAPIPMQGQPPGFPHQLPESELRQKLTGLLEMRTLLRQGGFSRTVTELRVLNKDEKTVAVLVLTEFSPENGESVFSVQLYEVRGYQKWFLKLSRDLEKFGTPQPCTNRHLLKIVLAATGRVPQDYSSKFSVPLEPDMDGRTAAKIIYRHLLQTMQQNEQGIIDDLDSEFLHDFRVAIRRTRSGLDMIQNVLEPEISRRFKKEFRYLGQITGPVRDLDVYLLMEEDYRARLPEHLQKGLGYFFSQLAEQRSKEQKKLVRALSSSRYRTILRDWQDYLKQKDTAKNGKQKNGSTLPAIGTIADRIIRKRFERVLSDGRAIGPDSPDAKLHKLRIQGKKLRYGLEFFSSLYPKKEMKQLIRQLKTLQNNLGLFNDLSVQQDMLNSYLAGLKPGSGKAKEMSAAIGGLLTNLHHEQQQVRAEFEAVFREFSAQENISLYRQLFYSGK